MFSGLPPPGGRFGRVAPVFGAPLALLEQLREQLHLGAPPSGKASSSGAKRSPSLCVEATHTQQASV